MRQTKTLEIEYYSDGIPQIGTARKFKIYSVSIQAKPYPKLTLNFMYSNLLI